MLRRGTDVAHYYSVGKALLRRTDVEDDTECHFDAKTCSYIVGRT